MRTISTCAAVASLFVVIAACGPKQDASQQPTTAPTGTAPYGYPQQPGAYPQQPGRVSAADGDVPAADGRPDGLSDRPLRQRHPRRRPRAVRWRCPARSPSRAPTTCPAARTTATRSTASARSRVRRTRLHHAERLRDGPLRPADAASRARALIMVEGSADAPLELPTGSRLRSRGAGALPSSSPSGSRGARRPVRHRSSPPRGCIGAGRSPRAPPGVVGSAPASLELQGGARRRSGPGGPV